MGVPCGHTEDNNKKALLRTQVAASLLVVPVGILYAVLAFSDPKSPHGVFFAYNLVLACFCTVKVFGLCSGFVGLLRLEASKYYLCQSDH